MKKISVAVVVIIIMAGCNNNASKPAAGADTKAANAQLAAMLENYYNKRMELLPLEATANGDSLYNNLLPADFTDSYREKLRQFFAGYKDSIASYKRDELDDNDQKSFDILSYEMNMALDGLKLHYLGNTAVNDNSYIPFDQFNALPLLMGQMGGGTGNQPFKTLQDHHNWLQRAGAFSAWADSAIVYFRKGMAANYVLPKTIVLKMIPQMQAMVVADPTKSLFYGPVKLMPAGFSAADKDSLTKAYVSVIQNGLVPAYTRLAAFLHDEYLPKARSGTGVNELPGGDEYYKYMVKFWTTTDKTADEIHQTGLSEVARIRGIMEHLKDSLQFKGDLNAFFEYMKTDKRFMPYKTPEEVLAAFHAIYTRIEPNLKKMYTLVPKSKFEIRQTEAFRAASASAEYYQGLPDGSRPGIFYVPIIDATKFNTTSGMESLFLHEAIPGHHYQISLQNENTSLPKFRRFIWYGAYGEGYALYCESLGKELGIYTDPYQYLGALGDEIHRAIRLVVDPAMHTGKMTREEAIKYMMDNEAISEEGATAEIERYMVYPGQALSYKTGALKIKELREKYTQQLGSKFNLADFHAAFLKDGCMPLEVLERSMDVWAGSVK